MIDWENCSQNERFQAAIAEFKSAELNQLVETVIDCLRAQAATGVFGGDIKPMNFWDEFCWAVQEGVDSEPVRTRAVEFSALMADMEEQVESVMVRAFKELPEHTAALLRAVVEDDDLEDQAALGEGYRIETDVLERLSENASRRCLGLLGPERAEHIAQEIEGIGLVWSALVEHALEHEIIAAHCDELLDRNGDLSELGETLIEAYVDLANEEDGWMFPAFIEQHGDELRSILRDSDIKPLLDHLRSEMTALLER